MNKSIIEAFTQLINLFLMKIDLLTNNDQKDIYTYKVDAFVRNLRVIKSLKKPIKSSDDVKHIKGFGKGTLSRIDEILSTGTLAEIKLLKHSLKGLQEKHKLIKELSTVIGIGAITAEDLINKHKITSLRDLKHKVRSGEIEVNDKIKLGLKYQGKYSTEIPHRYITRIYNNIKSILPIFSIVCGSYRREKPISHDIDLLLCDEKLVTMEDVRNSSKLKKMITLLRQNVLLIEDGLTSSDVKTKYMGFTRYKNQLYRIDIRLIPKESLWTAVLYFTGSYETNIKMRNKARKKVLKLNEYGLFNCMGKRIEINSEQDVFRRLGMKYLEPWER